MAPYLQLEHQHNESTTNGMRGLTSTDSTNKLLVLRANHPITWQDVITQSKAAAVARFAQSSKQGDDAPDIIETANVREEAD